MMWEKGKWMRCTGRNILALAGLSALLVLLLAADVIAAGWSREEGTWYYVQEDGSLLRDADTPDGNHVDAAGAYAGPAVGPGPWPVLEAEEQEEREMQAREAARLYEVEHPQETSSEESGPGEAYQRAVESILPYTSLWQRPGYQELAGISPRPQLSGRTTAGMPVEFFLLSVAGETSGARGMSAAIAGDLGRAYGICQFDYRYDLTEFLSYACDLHPDLWSEAVPCLDMSYGDIRLVGSAVLRRAFRTAVLKDYHTAVSDQLEYMRMLYWDGIAEAMNAAGFRLGERNIAISAALFSLSVNCGPQPGLLIEGLDPGMSDAEMLDGIYRLRNTVFAWQPLENRVKGTNPRYLYYEPELAADLMYGRISVDSEQVYGDGVEWHGDPF